MQFPFDNFATTVGLLTATGGETVHDTTLAIHYCIDGIGYSKAAITDGATPTTDAVSGAALTLTGTSTTGQQVYVVWCLDTSGNVKCIFGTKVAVNVSGKPTGNPPLVPSVPGTLAPFALQLLTHTGQASTVTFGSSNWNTSGFTNSIKNMIGFIKRPTLTS